MQPISSYTLDNHLRVVLQGPPGRGKSCLAAQFPRPYFIDLDIGLGSVIRWCERTKMQLPVGFDRLDIDESGAVVPPKLQYQRMARLVEEARNNPGIDTIVFDSATNLSPVLEAEVCRQQMKNSKDDFKDGRQFWGFYYTLGTHLMSQLKLLRKHVVLIAHEKENKLADGSLVYPIKIAWPGQLGNIIGAFFTDVWRCETETKGIGASAIVDYLIRTNPEFKYELKNSLGLPTLWHFKWADIEAKLKGGIHRAPCDQ